LHLQGQALEAGRLIERRLPRSAIGLRRLYLNPSGVGEVLPLVHHERVEAGGQDRQGFQWLITYRRPYNKATVAYGPHPKHDEANYAADAFETFAQALPRLTAPAGGYDHLATVAPPPWFAGARR
jgi:hypothetical protein